MATLAGHSKHRSSPSSRQVDAGGYKYESTYHLPEPHWSSQPRSLESLKESKALEVMSADGVPVISHDDVLCIRLMKASGLLSPGWRRCTDYHYVDGSRRILGYYNILTHERYASDFIVPSNLRSIIYPKFSRTLYLDCDVDVIFFDTHIDFILRNWADYGSRRQRVIDVFLEVAGRGLLKADPVPEAIERDVLPHLHIARYEFDWILKGHVGRLLYGSLVQCDNSRVLSQEVFPGYYITWGYAVAEEGTVYLDWKKYNGRTAMVKVYPLDFCGGWYLPYFKVELALSTPYFHSHGVRACDLATHPEMQMRFRKDLAHHLRRVLREPFVLSRLQKDLELPSRDDVIPALLSAGLTLSHRAKRFEEQRAAG